MKYQFNFNAIFVLRPWKQLFVQVSDLGSLINDVPKQYAWRWPCKLPSVSHNALRGIILIIVMAAVSCCVSTTILRAQSLNSILAHARITTAPASGKFRPDNNVHPFATTNGDTNLAVRHGCVRLSDNRVICGQVWTTLKTPFRVWLANIKQYRDLDIRLIKSIRGHVLAARELRAWRFQQEGSDIKNYAQHSRPRISFAYSFTMLNGKTITGTLEAPLYVRSAGHTHDLIMYKRVEGKPGEKISAVVYVKSVTLQVTPALRRYAAGLTRHLPLIHWRHMLAGPHNPRGVAP
ncbi:MAG: hypothetical protein M0Z50_14355 [Planctomycetia bacterium]|nr:hypothetical protein [Planctomycetia bacterium]